MRKAVHLESNKGLIPNGPKGTIQTEQGELFLATITAISNQGKRFIISIGLLMSSSSFQSISEKDALAIKKFSEAIKQIPNLLENGFHAIESTDDLVKWLEKKQGDLALDLSNIALTCCSKLEGNGNNNLEVETYSKGLLFPYINEPEPEHSANSCVAPSIPSLTLNSLIIPEDKKQGNGFKQITGNLSSPRQHRITISEEAAPNKELGVAALTESNSSVFFESVYREPLITNPKDSSTLLAENQSSIASSSQISPNLLVEGSPSTIQQPPAEPTNPPANPNQNTAALPHLTTSVQHRPPAPQADSASKKTLIRLALFIGIAGMTTVFGVCAYLGVPQSSVLFWTLLIGGSGVSSSLVVKALVSGKKVGIFTDTTPLPSGASPRASAPAKAK